MQSVSKSEGVNDLPDAQFRLSVFVTNGRHHCGAPGLFYNVHIACGSGVIKQSNQIA